MNGKEMWWDDGGGSGLSSSFVPSTTPGTWWWLSTYPVLSPHHSSMKWVALCPFHRGKN